MIPWPNRTEHMTPAAPTIEEQAAAWAVRLDRGQLTPAQRRELDAWLAADARHQGAFVRARAQWSDLERVAALAPGGLDLEPHARAPAPSATRRAIAAGLVIAAAALGAGLIWSGERGEVYASELGEVRRISLADGSQMMLNTSSKAIVDFSGGVRNVRLEYGEAVFDVAHDKTRPFVVTAQDVTVTAVGTEFAVRLRNADVAVTVTEGVVELRRDDKAMREPAQRIDANKRAEIVAAEPTVITSLDQTTAKRRLAWREGMVAFNGDTAAAAIAEMNRYNRRKVVLNSADLGAKPIVGYFRTSDVDGFAGALAAAFGAKVVKDGDAIRIVPKEKAR
jgi:transmembrane sensor